MDYKDYYKILGIKKDASADDIKKAYRKLAVKYHPDKNQGDKAAEEKFKEANEANEVLGNAERRKKYDDLGQNWQNFQGSGNTANGGGYRNPQSGFSNEDFYGDGSQFSSFFDSIFGGASFGGSRQRKGQDHQMDMYITIEEAFSGTTKTISDAHNAINVKIKPGTKDGQVLRVKGKGGAGAAGGAAGDLLLAVHIKPHNRFERKGDDLYFDQTVDLYTAVLGGKAEVKGIDKSIVMTIPEGTDTHKTLRLKGMGMPLYGNPTQRGDAYVRIVVQIPKNLTAAEKDLFKQLSALKQHE